MNEQVKTICVNVSKPDTIFSCEQDDSYNFLVFPNTKTIEEETNKQKDKENG